MYAIRSYYGMRQRIVIAIALSCNPKLIIADEPTTALDVTVQAQIIDLLKAIVKEQDTSIIMITHDLGVVAKMCNSVNIMYAGKVVEHGTIDDIFYRPQHPYTKGLLRITSYNVCYTKLLRGSLDRGVLISSTRA